MSRIQDILIRARDTLADPNGSRWSDARLIRLVDEAQKDICRRAKLLRTKTIIAVYAGQATYQLPPDLLLLDRVVFQDATLPLLSYSQLDNKDSFWEVKKGTVEACVYDKQNRGSIRLYPIPKDEVIINYTFSQDLWLDEVVYEIDQDYGVVISGALEDIIDTDYGIATDIIDTIGTDYGITIDTNSSNYGLITYISTIEKGAVANDSTYGITVAVDGYTLSDDVGVLTDIQDEFGEDSFDFGILTEWYINDTWLTVYYLKNPSTITKIEDTLEIDDIFDSAIKYYVVGKALRDDMDTQNRQVGNEELAFYERELNEAIKDDYIDFTRNSNKQYIVSYKNGF